MARKKTPTFIPDPEYQEAYGNAIDTAHVCAATLFGEQLVEDPAREASPRALMTAMAMMYFLIRLDPKDLRGLLSEGGLTQFWKPFPPDYAVPKDGAFADFPTAR